LTLDRKRVLKCPFSKKEAFKAAYSMFYQPRKIFTGHIKAEKLTKTL